VSEAGISGDDRGTRGPSRDLEDAWVDPDTLGGVRRRDPQSLARFFDLAFPYVYNLAFRLVGNKEAAEDVTQDVFVKVYQAADRLQTDRHPKPWLTTITYNRCRDLARRAAARPEVPDDGNVIGERSADASTPEDVILREERRRLTERALSALDEELRAVVILHDFCGMTHESIAEIMELGAAAVRKRYSRALKRMAEIIKGLT
jgi:RNA polymerase sigma-70 factor (ECF subfamily)